MAWFAVEALDAWCGLSGFGGYVERMRFAVGGHLLSVLNPPVSTYLSESTGTLGIQSMTRGGDTASSKVDVTPQAGKACGNYDQCPPP